MKEESKGSKCKFWVPKKRRFCSNTPLPNSSFCGNHTTRSPGDWVLCPIDPSHSVLQENLQSHLKRCPLLKRANSLSLQPFYQKGINSGHSDDIIIDSTSLMKRTAVYAMNAVHFSQLITKIQSIHASICSDIRDSHKIPDACHMWINGQVDPKLPFQEKHVSQQASILGNLEEIGALSDVSAVVEFGAGRGYLTQMLADCYGINQVFLVERKSYKLKADRSLRQIESLKLERLRIDIEDLNLDGVESLRGVPYLAIGKHLCGPATDMSLRCCLSDRKSNVEVRGLAIATCCHHLCQWKHYINQRYMSELGISEEDFNAISWFTSWAVDDHHRSSNVEDCSQHIQIIMDSDSDSDSASCGVAEIVRKMSAEERSVLGLMCKDIIDVGRLMWIKVSQKHEQSQLVNYVPSTVSPENHLLIASTKSRLQV